MRAHQIISTNYADVECGLYDNTTGKRMHLGDAVYTLDGERYVLRGGSAPHRECSTGRVLVAFNGSKFPREFFPSVVGCVWQPLAAERAHREVREAKQA